MNLYIGIDAGGTKTEFLLTDGQMRILGRSRKGSGDYRKIGLDGLGAMVCDGIRELLASCGRTEKDISAVCLGMPNFSEVPENDSYMKEWFARQFPDFPVYLVNDALVGWAGGLALRPGIHLVAGTGAIAVGVENPADYRRCGGWHTAFSDEGSGYWLGLRTMGLFFKEVDGRLPKGALYTCVREKFCLQRDLDAVSLWEREYLPYRDRTASLQLILLQAAELGDRAAMELYQEAGRELALLVRSLFMQMDHLAEPTAVSCSGGLLKSYGGLWESLRASTSDLNLRWQEPLYSPTEGAVLLARAAFEDKILQEGVL